jgi:hypothetical protein
MPTDYPHPVEDHFLLQAVFHAYAMNVTNREVVYCDHAEPEFRVSTNELVRAALNRRYAVATMYVEHDGQPRLWSEEAWALHQGLFG